MRLLGTMLTVLLFWGCYEYSAPPTGPGTTNALPDTTTPPPNNFSPRPSLWWMVLDRSGGCIVPATATVVAGQAVGTVVHQEPCGAWDYSGGITFYDLTSGVELTIRFSAPGYADKELTVTPPGQQIMQFELSPLEN